MFNIAATRFNLREHSLEIYVSGCNGDNGIHCPCCHNPELWDSNVGIPWKDKQSEIITTLESAGPLISSVRIYGGELMEKPHSEVLNFLSFLKGINENLELWLFTRFDFEAVSDDIKFYLDYVKCGKYDISCLVPVEYYGVTLASSNQKIFKKGVDWNVLCIH